jgi:NADH-quinone oxidoreductase subunit J
MLIALAFYLFAAVSVAAAVMVVVARNPVHSVLFLILTFFSSAGLFMLTGAEFLALILIVVYVGAVAVLFLFVVMMLDIDITELRQGVLDYVPLGGLIGLIMLVELGMALGVWVTAPEAATAIAAPVPKALADGTVLSNTEALGRVLYSDFIYVFQASGLVLLVAMIGAIVLTLRERPGVRRQSIAAQVGRLRSEGVELKDVRPGQGL